MIKVPLDADESVIIDKMNDIIDALNEMEDKIDKIERILLHAH